MTAPDQSQEAGVTGSRDRCKPGLGSAHLARDGQYSKWKISNYALMMLIIFYLQTEGILPSVKFLQENLTKEESCLIDQWQCGYPADISKWPYQDHCKKSSMELLYSFFKFYANFNFEEQVLSPYDGLPIEKKEMNLHTGKKFYFQCVKGLCLQDPFERSQCITKGYPALALENWKNYCTKSGDIIEKLLETSTNPPDKGLLSIFEIKLELQEDIINKAIKKAKVKATIKENFLAGNPDSSYEITFKGNCCNEKTKMWVKYKIRNVIKSVFENVLKMKIVEMPENSSKGSCRKGQQYMAVLPLINFLDLRKIGRVITEVEDNSLESEIKISEWIVSQYYQNYQVENLDPFIVLHASCHWIRNQDFLCIHLKPVASTKKDGGLGIMDNIVRLTNVILDFEIQKPSLLGLD